VATPEVARLPECARQFQLKRPSLNRTPETGGELLARLVYPMFELWRVADVEAIEEGAAIQMDCGGPVRPADRLFERTDVATDARPERHRVNPGDRFRTQVSP